MNLDIQILFKKYNYAVYNFILTRVYYDKDLAQDLTQEVFIKVIKSRAKFDDKKGSEINWLLTISRNLIIDYSRKRKIKTIEMEGMADTLSDKSNDAEESIMLQTIKSKLNELDEASRDLIVWRYISGLSYEEIALIVGKNANATKTAVSRALNKLKSLVNNE